MADVLSIAAAPLFKLMECPTSNFPILSFFYIIIFNFNFLL
jgi:hypothetical protein